MLDVVCPTTDGRKLVMRRYTQPDDALKLLMARMKKEFGAQPPAPVDVHGGSSSGPRVVFCSEDLAKVNSAFPSLFKDLLSQNARVPKVGLSQRRGEVIT